MSTRWWSFLTGILLAVSMVYWGLRLFVKSAGVPAGAVVAVAGPVGQGDLTRLLGTDPPPQAAATVAEAPADARFQLIGVVTPRLHSAAGEGLALIAVDGKPARAYRVGAVVDGQTVLKAVAARGAQLGLRDGDVQVKLQLASLPPAATGSLPAAVSDASGQPAAPVAVPNAPANQLLPVQPLRRMPPPTLAQPQPAPRETAPSQVPEGFQTH